MSKNGDRRLLGPWMSVAMVMGYMIGSAIFLLPATLAPYGVNALIAWGVTVGHARGALRRVFDAVMRSRARRANEEIARHLQHSGGRLTDEIEREMMQRLTRNWNLRL